MEIKFSFNLDIHSFLTVPASEQKKKTQLKTSFTEDGKLTYLGQPLSFDDVQYQSFDIVQSVLVVDLSPCLML